MDALLILENVKMARYVNEDRRIGFDAETIVAILNVNILFHASDAVFILFNFDLQPLAQFHATCIALRHLQAYVYKEKIYPYLTAVNLLTDDTRIIHVNFYLHYNYLLYYRE